MDARQSGFLDSGNDFFLETNYLGLWCLLEDSIGRVVDSIA
jgi:hypothetical protein